MNVELPRQKLDLASAIAEGDIRVLLMVLVHMTGDERWLEPPYKPKRDVRLIPDPQAGVPPEIQDEIRAAVLKLFENGDAEPVITDPGDELMLRMMRATLGGENVAPEYAPLMREEMGFVPREARWTEPPSNDKLAQQHVLIVGAGVCAIALGVALGRLGIPYTIVEKNAELGGTWYVNRYPGCGVDTPNHSYSFSFGARNPWTRYFAQAPGTARLSQKGRARIRHPQASASQYRTDVVALGREQAPLDLDAEDRGRRGDIRIDHAGQRDRPAQRSLARAFQGRRRLSRARSCTRRCGPTTSSSTASMSP